MYNFKKVVFTILAFLPLAYFFLVFFSGIFDADFSLSELSWGFTRIGYVGDSPDADIQFVYKPQSIVEMLLGGFVDSTTVVSSGSVFYAIFRFLIMFQETLGMPYEPFGVVMVATFYLLYYVVLYFVSMLVDLLTLIPKLCERLFKL